MDRFFTAEALRPLRWATPFKKLYEFVPLRLEMAVEIPVIITLISLQPTNGIIAKSVTFVIDKWICGSIY